MAVRVREVVVCIRKGLIISIRTSYRSARDHPFILVMVIFLLLLYRCFPSLFAFLVSSSPVIFCTALLLGALLSYGEPNIPEIEEEDKKTSEISFLRAGSVASDPVVIKGERFTSANYVERKRESKEKAKEVTSGEGSSSDSSKSDSDVHDEEERNDTLTASRSLIKGHQKQAHRDKQGAGDRERLNQDFIIKREFTLDGLVEGVSNVNEVTAGGSNKDQKEVGGIKVEINKPVVENHFDSSLGSPWEPIEKQDASSDSESDRAESSSPDASMAEIMPMLDELHPLLDSKDPQPALMSIDNSDASSMDSSQDHESENGSAVEEAENQDEEDDDEGPEEKDDATEVVVKWTADDQKNLMDLGSSELERNQRLENLIAKRRARKNLRFEFEKNLIDLDGNDSLSSMDQLSRLQVQIPSISATRRNPFDLPYDSEEAMPIPGSAPSVLLPTRNPFDLPFDQADESGTVSGEGSSQQEFVSVPQREMFFRRHESFSVGASFPGEFRQERRESQFRPYFVADRMDWKESHLDSYQRQLSERNDSKVSSVPETDSMSSVAGQVDDKELIEQEFHQEINVVSPAKPDVEPMELGSQSSDEADSLDSEQQRRDVTMVDHDSISLNRSNATGQSYEVPGAFGAVEEDTRREDDTSAVSEKLEVIEERFYDSCSSTSSETNEKSLRMNIDDEASTLDQENRDSSEDPTNRMLSVPADSQLLGRMAERVDDSQTAEPIYDSSPSAIDKSLSNAATLDEDLFYEGKGGSQSGSSLASETQAESSGFGMPSRHAQEDVDPEDTPFDLSDGNGGEILNSGSGGLWVASPSLCSVEENESRSREISEIREHDVISIGFSGGGDDLSNQVATLTPRTPAGRIMRHSRFSSAESESCEDTSVDMDAILQPAGEEAINSAASAKKLESMISTLNLPSIPEENLDDFILEEEHHGMTNPTQIVSFTGLQVIEEPNIGLSDIDCELSFLQQNSTAEVGTEGSVSDGIHGEITGLHSVEPMEKLESSRSDAMDSGPPKTSDDLKEETDEVLAEVKEFKGMDEGLLSELDVVGDFHAGNLQPDQNGSRVKLELDNPDETCGADSSTYSEMQEIQVNLLASETRSIEHISLSLRPSGGHTTGLHVDPEQTVYNSKMHAPEACSHEAVVPETTTAKHYMGSSEIHETGGVPKPAEASSELLVLEEKSIEDIRPAFKTFSEGGVDEVERYVASEVPEPSKIDSDLLVLEAKSIEDLNLAFQQLDQGGHKRSLNTECGPSKIFPGGFHDETTVTHADLEVVEAKSPADTDHLPLKQISSSSIESPDIPTVPEDGFEANVRHPEPEVLEVRSAEEFELALKEAVAREAGSAAEQSTEKSKGAEELADVPKSDSSSSKKAQKKLKYANSGSNSSSSDSD